MPAEIADGLAIIERSAEIQGRLINDLLDSSRIHAGKMAVEVRLINLVDVLALAIASVQRLAEKKAIVIATDFPASNECMVLGDPIRMQQVFWNLLSNALKFTPRGGRIHITLDSSKGKPRPMAEVRFCDSGVGIRDEFIGCIFQRFTQADSSLTRLHGGLGLGLSLVKSLVELHQGTVKAESPGVGKGATFTIALPLASVCPSDRAWAPEIQDAKSARLDGVRALVVDDDTSNLDLFSMMLGSFGAQVRTAESAAQARIVLAEFRPDILLSDISMPIEDGIDLIRSVRNLGSDAGGDIPAIALTAFAGNDDARRVLAAGFSAHVAKPVAKVTLLRAVARLVPGKISPPSSSI